MRGFSLRQGIKNRERSLQGFTIVELLIVVVVIAILAAITIVAYNGITNQAQEAGLKSDLTTGAKQLHLEQVENGQFPDDNPKPSYLGDRLQYARIGSGGFCLTASANGKAFHTTHSGSIKEGACDGHAIAGGSDGGGSMAATMQTFTSSHCSSLDIYNGSNPGAIVELTDSRGGTTQTYEVARLADNKCWMLTNLKLGSTTGSITLTPEDSDVGSNFTLPVLATSGSLDYDNPGAYGPVPGDTGSGSTNYGYLYNWPAASAGESRTSHNQDAGNAPHSICPANWRLPTGGDGSGNDFGDLDIAFGGPGQSAWSSQPNIPLWNYSGAFKGVFSGGWAGDWVGQGGIGILWSASTHPNGADYAFNADFDSDGVHPGDIEAARAGGLGVRCLLN